MASSAYEEGYRVKDSVRALLGSRELKPLLERFHQRLEELGAGASIRDGKVVLSAGTKTDEGMTAELLAGHLFKELAFESVFDPELMQQAADLGRALNALRNELFASAEFLKAFADMLKASKNCDDLSVLAKLCLHLYASDGSDLRLASMSEVSNPELVIEMTKSYAALMLSMRARAVTPAPNIGASASPAQTEGARDEPAQAAPAPPKSGAGAPAVKLPPQEKPGPACPAQTPAPHPPLSQAPPKPKTLAQRLAHMGLSDSLAAAYVNGCADEPAAIKKLDGYVEKFGADLTIMAVCRNRSALLTSDSVEPLLQKYASRASRFSGDAISRKKYDAVENALKSRLGISTQQSLVVLDAVSYRLADPADVLSNLDSLLAKIRHDAVRMMVLGNPPLICRRRDVDNAIRSTPRELLNRPDKSVKAPEAAAPPQQAAAAPEKAVKPANPLEALGQKLAEVRVGKELIDELLGTPRYRDAAEACLNYLQAFINLHGQTFTLLALYKNRALLLNDVGNRALARMKSELKEVRDDKELLAKFRDVVSLLVKELDVPEEAVYSMLPTCKSRMRPEMLMENVQLLLARVPKERLRAVLLASPSKLAIIKEVEILLADYPAPRDEAAGGRLADELVRRMAGKRPEAFIRAYVKANADTLLSRSVENAAVKIEFAARTLLTRASGIGMPGAFVRQCMEAGMLDFSEIKAKFESGASPAAAESVTADASEATKATAAVKPGDASMAVAPVAAPAPAAAPAELAQGQAVGATEAAAPAEEIPAHRVGEPLAEEPLGVPAGTVSRTLSAEEAISEMLSRYSINGDIRRDILSRCQENPEIDAPSRIKSAIDLFEQCVKPGQSICGPVRDFLIRRATRDALFAPDASAFDDVALEAAERISNGSKKSPMPPSVKNGKNGLQHIKIPAGDIPIFEKIRSFPIPDDVQMYLESRHLDAHEFAYAVLKVLRWVTNRHPQPQTELVRDRNCANVAGEAAADVLRVLGPMLKEVKHGGETYFEMKNESEMDEASVEVFRILKQVRFSIG